MRILFLPLITRGAALGTISRCLAIAEVLQEQGHSAFFVTGGPSSRYVAESKFEYQERFPTILARSIPCATWQT